jgi:hypothetical protein
MEYSGDSTHSEKAYCVKCRTDIVITAPKLVPVTSRKGTRWALKGACPHCGTVAFKFIPKSRADALTTKK